MPKHISCTQHIHIQITEAIAKGVPVVAYRAGGIPFQVREL